MNTNKHELKIKPRITWISQVLFLSFFNPFHLWLKNPVNLVNPV